MGGLEAADFERNSNRLENALAYNLKLAENHPLYPNAPGLKPKDFIDKISFLKSESIGVYSLLVLDLLQQQNEIQFGKIYEIISEKICPFKEKLSED